MKGHLLGAAMRTCRYSVGGEEGRALVNHVVRDDVVLGEWEWAEKGEKCIDQRDRSCRM